MKIVRNKLFALVLLCIIQDSLDYTSSRNEQGENKRKKEVIAAFVALRTSLIINVFISGIDNQNLTLQTYHKSTYMGLLLNFKSFTSFSCNISLIKCLIDTSFKICSNWNSYHSDIKNIKSSLNKMYIHHS